MTMTDRCNEPAANSACIRAVREGDFPERYAEKALVFGM